MDLLRSIVSDSQSGSVEILENTMNIIKEYLYNEKVDKEYLVNNLYQLIEAHNQMAILYHFVDGLLSILFKNKSEDFNQECINYIDRYMKKYENIHQKIAKQLLDTVILENKKVLIHSNSRTLVQVFHDVRDNVKNLSFIQTESRPSFEGIQQAQKLADAGYEIKLIVDSAAVRYFNDIDYIIFGADAIFKDSFINKIGTFSLALAGVHFAKKVYVMADERKKTDNLKYLDTTNLKNQKRRSPEEVWNQSYHHIVVENYYFEETPNHLVTRIFTG